jgi:alkanesulfonate monooxygenase SsuD/methylene tetrahydromethanopterin reductase-like flavin-dependent oxidoreductase (luciferase family)
VQDASIYTRPEEPVPIYVSGFAPQAAELAGGVGDGYRLAMPDADLVRAFRAAGGGHKPVQARMKLNWDADRDVAAAGCAPPCGPPARRGRRPAPSGNCPANSP